MREPFSPMDRMLRRGLDPEYESCEDYVARTLLTEALIGDEIRAANAAARARNKAKVDANYQAWLNAGGTRAGNYAIGAQV